MQEIVHTGRTCPKTFFETLACTEDVEDGWYCLSHRHHPHSYPLVDRCRSHTVDILLASHGTLTMASAAVVPRQVLGPTMLVLRVRGVSHHICAGSFKYSSNNCVSVT